MDPITIVLVITIILMGLIGAYHFQLHKKREQELHHLAYFDSLTGLPNRVMFKEQAQTMIQNIQLSKHRIGFFLVDIDAFKSINDSHGHAVGDEYLMVLAHRLQTLVNERVELMGEGSCFAARLSGDEFVLVIDKLRDARESLLFVQRMFKIVTRRVSINDDITIRPSISVGISIFPHDGGTLTDALKAADLALYNAKADGKNTFAFHDVNMRTKFEKQVMYQAIIRDFIDSKNFNLHYQPIVDFKYGDLCNAECLFAGNKAKYPSLDIQTLMETAESTGDIIELGRLILEKACLEFMQYIKPKITHPDFVLAVNISAKQLEKRDFIKTIKDILERTGMPPNMLALEVTETSLIVDYADTSKKIEELNALGVRLVIDDFGKGYSSMSYLRKLTVHKLKIDRSFIEDINDQKSTEVLRTIITMCKSLGIIVVAEGVETVEQYRFLRNLNCERVQGYLISSPIAAQYLYHFPGYILPTQTIRKVPPADSLTRDK